MITIGQLARCVGVSVKTIRVYHDKGLLPEPGRDASGYRRYGAEDVVALIKIRTLSEAGVPLARIRELRSANEKDFRLALHAIDEELAMRIRGLQATQGRLRELASGQSPALPDGIGAHLENLARWGFTSRWVDLQRDLWILVFATHPDQAAAVFRDQSETLSDPELRQLFLDYDGAYDLDPGDPRIDDLARRIVEATRSRYGSGELPQADPVSEIPALIQDAVNAASPAWRRLDTLIRTRLGA
ncbi:MerR family transcriptional regulator [Trebonia kvetii]|uniref:MerR family transcriptional regulator n=1 Tax=Trebonia kvetii TaxID=2480626 RepID=A0A6P2C1L5_9ACTN|nr:MerR family transcriptional regulator [Trebonia kvetii]TVZ04847.1 MerR family transcriptional regulator [Trebonia kvetii]